MLGFLHVFMWIHHRLVWSCWSVESSEMAFIVFISGYIRGGFHHDVRGYNRHGFLHVVLGIEIADGFHVVLCIHKRWVPSSCAGYYRGWIRHSSFAGSIILCWYQHAVLVVLWFNYVFQSSWSWLQVCSPKMLKWRRQFSRIRFLHFSRHRQPLHICELQLHSVGNTASIIIAEFFTLDKFVGDYSHKVAVWELYMKAIGVAKRVHIVHTPAQGMFFWHE